MLRKASMAAILAGAVGVPYAVWNGDDALDIAGGWLDTESGEAPADGDSLSITATSHSSPEHSVDLSPRRYYDPTASGHNAYPAEITIDHGATVDPQSVMASGATMAALAEVFRMDVSRAWVTQRFPRVTTTLADTNYDGLRIPYISGMTPADVTGSLTYYFDREQQLQRITFHGTTGDTSQLVTLLTQQMEFEQQDALGGELYTRSWLGQNTSVCRIRPAGVLHSGASNSRYEILLELNRDSWRSNLSETATQLID